MIKTIKGFLALTLATIALGACWVPSVLAHSIDYTAYDIQPQASFNGQSGNFRLIDPVAPGTPITFNLTLELIESAGGGTSLLPVTVLFGVKNTGGPETPFVYFGTPASTSQPETITYVYDKVGGKIASLMTPVTAIAPGTPGSYHFKVQALDGFKSKGFQPGEGIVIHFTVAEVMAEPIETELTVAMANSGIYYKAPSNTLFATLREKSSGAPMPGQPIDFFLNGASIATVNTGADGISAYEFSTSGLTVGDHTVAANFQGKDNFLASSGSANQCVTYRFVGYQPPVLVQQSTTSGLGIGLFQGKVIPVKIKIADFYNAPVSTAEARVYFAKTVAGAAEIQAVAIQPSIADDGSLMRYDPTADQYILNWNISNLPNGDYNIRVGMEEGECATGHWVPVRIGKASK